MTAYKNTKSTSKKSDGYVRLYQFLDEKKYILGSIVFIGLFIVFMFNSFATLEPVSSITVESTTLDYTKSEEGSWQYTKTAKWISKGKARINIKLETIEKPNADYTDVILVLDTSSSMVKDKIERLKSDVNELIDYTIQKGNKIALITFNDTATIVNDLTDDTMVLKESVNNLEASGGTDYYQALLKVDDILSTYNKESNRTCTVLFLTDGLPTTETPNEVGMYKLLKDKYDYLSINGIQYELGDKVLDGVKNITDIQFMAGTTTLNEFLYKASKSTFYYDNFTLTDYIDTEKFNLKGVSNVSTTFGGASIEGNQVTWNLDGFKTGLDAELTIDINLNDDLIGVGGVYPTHTKTDVAYKIDSVNTTESTTKTTILKDNYIVTYEANTPAGCVVSGLPSSKAYLVFDTVKLDDSVPTCIGYQFKEWKIDTNNIKKVGKDRFIMPESNVTIKAVWKKLSINKTMNGTVYEGPALYDMVADSSIGLDTDIDFSIAPTDENSGVYTRNGTENDQYPVYYYRGNIDNNNLLFANYCWKMVRTTSTGGVKLIYNGIPTADYENIDIITKDEYINISNDETYPYTYDESTNVWTSTNKANSKTGTISFSVSEPGIYVLSYSVSSEKNYDKAYFYKDNVELKVDSGTNSGTISLGNLTSSSVIMVKYTKDGSGSSGSDSVSFSLDKASGNVIKRCNNTDVDSQIGTSSFDSSSNLIADVSYMYGTKYAQKAYGEKYVNILKSYSVSGGTTYYYGDYITYSNGIYTLNNSFKKPYYTNNMDEFVGMYTCKSTTNTTCSTVYYIARVGMGYQYVLPLSDGVTDPSTQTMTMGKGMVDNGDGTYTLTNVTVLEKSKISRTAAYDYFKGYYICDDFSSTTCEKKYIITGSADNLLGYDRTFNFVYGNDVVWDGTKYTLVDTFTSTNFWATDRKTLAKKYHYTCLNATGECTEVYYIYFFGADSSSYYLTLTDGKNIEQAKTEMFSNVSSSEVKKVIDAWYENNMIDYTEKLEDTIWCNDRTLISGSLIGKDTEDLNVNDNYSYFGAYNGISQFNPSLACSNTKKDGFTVSVSSGGNGALTYPIGMLTADEMMLAGSTNSANDSYYLYTGQYYWSLSPLGFYYSYRADVYSISSKGNLSSSIGTCGVRPSISLAFSNKVVGGDGTVDDPYIVK